MSLVLDETHRKGLRSWVASANQNETDFPIQNLPFGRFKRPGDREWSIGVAIGDYVLDAWKVGALPTESMSRLMALGPNERRAIRRNLSRGLAKGSDMETKWTRALVPMSDVTLGLPCDIGDYTDFYVGIHHATTVGKLFRPDNPLLPNYKWVPIGYHGRASTIVASGAQFPRPRGQIKLPTDDAPMLSPTQRLDYEVELGILMGRPNKMGEPITIEQAEDHIFGLTLFNDWSARDFQAWEYQPLGPFLSKNFASTISPWMVTLEALAPFRKPFRRRPGDPAPLPYLESDENRKSGSFGIVLEARIQTERMRAEGRRGDVITCASFADSAYWTPAQLVTHHTVNGCAMNTGDLLGTGTLSGPYYRQGGSLLELTEGGKSPLTLSTGEERGFLEDGDSVELRARCSRPGYRTIGFGACVGTVRPAAELPARREATVALDEAVARMTRVVG